MSLKQILKDVLSSEERELLVRGFDIVGDIAIIIIPEELEVKKSLIAEAVLASNKRIKSVARRAGVYGGEFRTLPLEHIGGERRFETIHKENGVLMYVDVEKVYFSTRSGTERMRIASLVKEGERILIMFSGIGPYPLMISRHSEAQSIVGVEKNPVAHSFAEKNLLINKKCSNISLFQGDVRKVLPQLGIPFDRICMVLPKDGEEFIRLALASLGTPGWLHFYDFQERSSHGLAVEKVRSGCKAEGRVLVKHELSTCGHTAPRVHRLCVDAFIK